MILSNFKTFTKKVCNGNEQTAYRYLDEIERGAMANASGGDGACAPCGASGWAGKPHCQISGQGKYSR